MVQTYYYQEYCESRYHVIGSSVSTDARYVITSNLLHSRHISSYGCKTPNSHYFSVKKFYKIKASDSEALRFIELNFPYITRIFLYRSVRREICRICRIDKLLFCKSNSVFIIFVYRQKRLNIAVQII